jgi:2Fe-2S ferredoxin
VRVRIEPSGIALDVDDGETVMTAATRAGYRWPTVCGGHAECGVCALEVIVAPAPLPPPAADESARLDELPERTLHPDHEYRLACQLVPVDGLVVRKRGVARDD